MSRLTSAQVIALGDYLQPDFDPSTLTVSQLLGIFGYHNINYPSQYTKPKLVQLFKDEIKPRSSNFKQEKLKRENSQASDDGITDGHTGRPLSEGRTAATTVRRSTRRTSRAPSEAKESEPTRPDPPKRRRSTAEPALGGPSRRKTLKPAQPVLVEESEPEEVPVRKVSRSKKGSGDAGSQGRKVSQTLPSEDRDSGWEDNNIFQSGAESSSPLRPPPVRPRPRRSSAAPRSRKSTSAPPEYALSSKGKEKEQPAPERESSVKPPESTFEPELPPGMVKQSRRVGTRSRGSSVQPPEDIRDKQIVVVPDSVEEVEEPLFQESAIVEGAGVVVDQFVEETEDLAGAQEEEIVSEEDAESDDEQVTAISKEHAKRALVHPRSRPNTTPWYLRFLFTFLVLVGSGAIYNYKQESSPVGFCETGKATNERLEAFKARWTAIESCNRENRTALHSPPDPHSTQSVLPPEPSQAPEGPTDYDHDAKQVSAMELCPPLPLIPIPHPDTCTPCPAHASCSPSTMTCENGFLIRPHPLLFFLPLPTTPSPSNFNSQNSYTIPSHSEVLAPSSDTIPQLVSKYVALLLDGLPGLGSVALPPRCIEDPRRKRLIGALGRGVESILAAERGRRLCAGIGASGPTGSEAEEAKKWGVEVDVLKEGLRKKTSPNLVPNFEEDFNEAIQQLVQWGGVFVGEDPDGKRYLAHRTPQMDWTCALTVKTRESWAEWRNTLIGLSTVIMGIIAFRRRQAQNAVENERVASLVQIALDLLRNQELAHHTDPITAPQPFLSSLQLRDLVLQDEHSVNARRKLWERVERVVEGNANVRTNLEEVEGGDEMRVWRWVGNTGRTLPSIPGSSKGAQHTAKVETSQISP